MLARGMTRSYVGPLALFAFFLIAFVWLRFGPAVGPSAAQIAQHTPLSRVVVSGPPAVTPRLGAGLILPVSGVARTQLTDSWGQARAEGRTHEGIDIMAPQGTPVVAVADGRIVKFFESVRGGITIYEFDTSERLVYYYAHLSARAAGLAENDQVRQGEVIGYVGMTGNAPVPHLHFEIQRLTPAKHWWEAESINPYPYLRAGQVPSV